MKEKNEIKKSEPPIKKPGVYTKILQESQMKAIEVPLKIGSIRFLDSNIITMKDPETDKIYVTISAICGKIGFNKKESDSQELKILADVVLSKGVRLLGEFLCIELSAFLLWVMKIPVTSEMENKNPRSMRTLKKYQRAVMAVLGRYFIANGDLEYFISRGELYATKKK